MQSIARWRYFDLSQILILSAFQPLTGTRRKCEIRATGKFDHHSTASRIEAPRICTCCRERSALFPGECFW